jgi:DNA-binding NtrC family response regulator
MSWIANLLRPAEPRIRVLGILPCAPDRTALIGIAERAGWELKLAADTGSALRILKHYEARVIICDREQPDCEWRETIRLLTAHAPASCLILTSSVTNDRLWLEVIERGGYDVLTMPFHENRVLNAVRLGSDQVRK